MPDGPRVRFGPFLFDRRESRLWRDGSPVDVTPRALGVLDALIARPGELLTKDELVAKVWPRTVVTDAAVAKRVQELRTALGDDSRSPRYVQTLYRRGFRFVGELAEPVRSPRDLVGREQVLEQLTRARRTALDGERTLVLLTGEAGIGKSRLLSRFLDDCDASGARVARGFCSPYGQDEPFSPIVSALASIGNAPGLDLGASLRLHAPSWVRIVEGVPDRAASPVAHNRQMLLLELITLLGALAKPTGLVLGLDDLHWSDPSTLVAIDALLRHDRPSPLLVVATLRDGAIGSDEPGWRSISGQLGHSGRHHHRLTRFSPAEVQRYLATRFDAAAAARLAPALHRRAEGLPLYVSWLGDWVEDAGVAGGDDIATIEHTFPDSLVRLFELQLTTLSHGALQVLEAASVVGPEFSVDVVAQVLDRTVHETELLLRDVLRASGILAPTPRAHAGRFAFTHALLHETLYARVDASRARNLHRRCAEVLRARPLEDAAEVARHLACAGDFSGAAEMRLEAARSALGSHGYVEAGRHFESAARDLRTLALTERRDDLEIDALLGLAHCLIATEGYSQPRVCETYEAAYQMSRTVGTPAQRFDAIAGVAGYLVMRGRLADAASRDADLFDAAAACSDPVTLALAHCQRAEHRMYRGRLEEAHVDLEAAQTLLDERRIEARGTESWWHASVAVRQYASQLAGERGEFDTALRHRDVIFAALGRDVHPYTECVSCYFSAAVYLAREEISAAAVQTARMMELAEAHEFAALLIWARTIHGYLLCSAGDHARGVPTIRAGLAQLDETGTRLSRGLVLSVLALGLAQSGEIDEANALFGEAQRHVDDTGEALREPPLHLLRAEALASVGRPDERAVRAALEQSLECARDIGSRHGALRALTRIVARTGDRREDLAHLLAALREGGDTPIVRAAHAVLAGAR
jgi:DNA-binding winged helix-turn-helix (wHTH) protein/tetratricopeptide (TPR) repeat protein